MLLDVQNLKTYFHTRDGIIKAVNDVSFCVDKNETLAIVGESGSGKSVACYSLLKLIPQPPGKIEGGTALFEGRDLLQMREDELRTIRGNDIALIFQDPMTSLNPYLSVGEQLIEPLTCHHNVSKKDARLQAIEVLNEVGIDNPESRYDGYPHEFSGGMRQRVMIAMALITEPKLLICDEPTTALDVTIQAQILRLIKDLQIKRQIAVIFISHDLAVVSQIADRMAVLQKGKIVEQGITSDIFQNPQHDYTKKLLAAIPCGAKLQPVHSEQPLVTVNNLRTWFRDNSAKKHTATKGWVKAIDDVSIEIGRGEILGLVGESGSGKSTLGRAILGLSPVTEGEITFNGHTVSGLANKQMRPFRRKMQIIFQDPYASLNPRMTVFDTLAEPLLYHRLATKKNVTEQVLALMDDVGLDRKFIRKYPHEFSGGQRQRIAIGRAIATKPEFIIADEPVSALDVTIQAQILDLILELTQKHNLTMLFISHDMAVVRYVCDRLVVLYHGKVVESGETETLYANPQQDYTQKLLAAIPKSELK